MKSSLGPALKSPTAAMAGKVVSAQDSDFCLLRSRPGGTVGPGSGPSTIVALDKLIISPRAGSTSDATFGRICALRDLGDLLSGLGVGVVVGEVVRGTRFAPGMLVNVGCCGGFAARLRNRRPGPPGPSGGGPDDKVMGGSNP